MGSTTEPSTTEPSTTKSSAAESSATESVAGSLATLVPPRERSTVQALASRLYRVAAQAGDASPMCRRVCFVVAACTPETSLERLSILVRYALWSVVLDDRLDGPGPDPAALGALRQAAVAAIRGGRAGAADPFWRELGGVVDDLAGCDPAGAAVARFGDALLDSVDAAIEHTLLGHAVASGGAPPPAAEQYLAVAARTINYHSFGYGLLAVTGRRYGAGELSVIGRALDHGGAAVRLANDLRSLDRDRTESTLNVLDLRTAAGAAVTLRYVRDEIRRRMRRHDAALAPLGTTPTGTTSPAGMLTRSLHLSVGLYRRTDLR